MVRAVLQAVAVGVSGWEPGRVASAEAFLPAIGHPHDFAGEYIDELVAARVPMTLAGPDTRRQPEQVYTEF
jgi:hypothetical protein